MSTPGGLLNCDAEGVTMKLKNRCRSMEHTIVIRNRGESAWRRKTSGMHVGKMQGMTISIDI
jgi:Tfp pilus assembly protein PilX